MSNEIDEDSFEQIFGNTLIKLADKLINTTNKDVNPAALSILLKSSFLDVGQASQCTKVLFVFIDNIFFSITQPSNSVNMTLRVGKIDMLTL